MDAFQHNQLRRFGDNRVDDCPKIILPVKTFHHLVTDCHMWWNPSYNDYQGFLLLFLAEILKKVKSIFSNLLNNDKILLAIHLSNILLRKWRLDYGIIVPDYVCKVN